GGVESPDAEVPLEDNHTSVVRDVWPQYASVLESGHLSGIIICSTGSRALLARPVENCLLAPDVLRTIAVRHEVDRRSVVTPHRPHVLAADCSQSRVFTVAGALP